MSPRKPPELPGVRDGDKNVDWREVAEALLEQNKALIQALEEQVHWYVSIDPSVPAKMSVHEHALDPVRWKVWFCDPKDDEE